MVEWIMRKKTDKPFDVIRWARDLADDDFIEPAAGEPPMLMMVSLSGDGFRRLAMITSFGIGGCTFHNRLYGGAGRPIVTNEYHFAQRLRMEKLLFDIEHSSCGYRALPPVLEQP
jgi:hypothetical protein